MPFKYAYMLPILCTVWFFLTFILTYFIAIYNKDVAPVFPYISDTGTWSPESCFFGLMLNIGAIIQALVTYIRYRQVNHLLDKETSLPPSMRKYNWICVILSTVAAFGICLVGNFQETNVLSIHMVGAFAAFGLGSIYQCIQTRASFQLYPHLGSKKINIARICLSAISCTAFIVTVIFGGISLLQFRGDDPTKWTKNDGGYMPHCISVAAEWILAITTMLYLLLFTNEFKKISFSEPLLIETVQQT
ncbi:unnamed protein product [Tenebrio molitor]|nr:unnamed protein product [Tenebrio molitor]